MAKFTLHPEGKTAMKFGAVGCVGFLVDISVLHLGLKLGLPALAARAISLTLAMHATFLINGLFVFRCVNRRNWPGQWLGYIGTNGFGNLCNYLIFAGLTVSRWPWVSKHGPALVLGSLTAYSINYLFVRLLVFGKPQERRTDAPACDAPLSGGGPAPAARP